MQGDLRTEWGCPMVMTTDKLNIVRKVPNNASEYVRLYLEGSISHFVKLIIPFGRYRRYRGESSTHYLHRRTPSALFSSNSPAQEWDVDANCRMPKKIPKVGT